MNRGNPDTERFFAALREALSPVATSEPLPPGLRSAGVLVPLRDAAGVVTVTLARRTERVPHHKGQICFPGGSRDPAELPFERRRHQLRDGVGGGARELRRDLDGGEIDLRQRRHR